MNRAAIRPARHRRLGADRSGVALIEFALMLPLFMAFVVTGLEFAYWVLANNRAQRLATMTADLVAQSGVGEIGMGEGQVYDLFSALDLTAMPYDLRNQGRVIISSVQGTDDDKDGRTENRFLWQRFDGAFVGASPILGCMTAQPLANLPASRSLPLNEILFHVQVSYNYQPLITRLPFGWLNLTTAITRTATFRARSNLFTAPTPDARFPAKSNCNSANGL